MAPTSTRALIACASLTAVLAGSTIQATSNAITWQGRTVTGLGPAGSVSFSWEGVQAMMTVTKSTSFQMTVASTFTGGEALWHAIVDGVRYSNVTTAPNTQQTVTLATGLDPSKTHNVTVWYATDPIAMAWPYIPPTAYQSILSFTVDGVFGPAPPQRGRKLLIIGDSITAGNQIDKATCKPDHQGTYGAKLCEDFGANCTTTAISGKGLYANCCDTNVTMDVLARLSLPGRQDMLFNDDDFVPDAVMINLGTNDFNHDNGTAWEAAYTATYVEFMHNLTVWHRNPALPIFCGVGPITERYMTEVVAAMAQAKAQYGITSYLLNYTGVTLDGCGHPGWVGHQEMYEVARPIISQAMGWA